MPALENFAARVPRCALLLLLLTLSPGCSSALTLYRADADSFGLQRPPRRGSMHPTATAPDRASSAERFEALRSFFSQALVRAHVAGGAVAIVENGSLSHAAGIGRRGHSVTTAMTDATRLRIGSIHKTILALATMHAVETGRLELDRPI